MTDSIRRILNEAATAIEATLPALVEQAIARRDVEARRRLDEQMPPASEPRTTSLTLRLTDRQYARLRQFAFDRRTTHQAVLEAALTAYLDKENG
jgi:predicted transcriptional regulator